MGSHRAAGSNAGTQSGVFGTTRALQGASSGSASGSGRGGMQQAGMEPSAAQAAGPSAGAQSAPAGATPAGNDAGPAASMAPAAKPASRRRQWGNAMSALAGGTASAAMTSPASRGLHAASEPGAGRAATGGLGASRQVRCWWWPWLVSVALSASSFLRFVIPRHGTHMRQNASLPAVFEGYMALTPPVLRCAVTTSCGLVSPRTPPAPAQTYSAALRQPPASQASAPLLPAFRHGACRASPGAGPAAPRPKRPAAVQPLVPALVAGARRGPCGTLSLPRQGRCMRASSGSPAWPRAWWVDVDRGGMCRQLTILPMLVDIRVRTYQCSLVRGAKRQWRMPSSGSAIQEISCHLQMGKSGGDSDDG